MTIFERLANARAELAACDIKKSGNNNGRPYFELADFLPTIIKLCQKHKLLPVVSFTADTASMTIFGTEGTDDGLPALTFTSPMGSASLKNCHEVQNIGAVETYQRRYLYMTAFEIVETDTLDATYDEPKQPVKAAKQPVQWQTSTPHDVTCPVCGGPVEACVGKNGVTRSPEDVLKTLGSCARCYLEQKRAAKAEAENGGGQG